MPHIEHPHPDLFGLGGKPRGRSQGEFCIHEAPIPLLGHRGTAEFAVFLIALRCLGPIDHLQNISLGHTAHLPKPLRFWGGDKVGRQELDQFIDGVTHRVLVGEDVGVQPGSAGKADVLFRVPTAFFSVVGI